jgi:D-lactate dehydrogenase
LRFTADLNWNKKVILLFLIQKSKTEMNFQEIFNFLPSENIKTRLIDLVAYASDAGFYHLQPKVIVFPCSESDIKQIFIVSKQYKLPITFRTGGTSLSGQSITDGILVDLSRHFRNIQIENEGNLIRLQPGVIGSVANAHLKKFKRKIGPDPSSISAAMVGGILSNNASGMCCGIILPKICTKI